MRSFYTPPGTSNSANPKAELLTPVAQIEIHSQPNNFGPANYFGPGGILDPTQSLISVTTTKALDQPVGKAEITLTAAPWGVPATYSWLDLIKPMDIVIVRLSRSGSANIRTVFVGFIDTVQEQCNVGEAGKEMRSVVIEASDLVDGLVRSVLFVPPRVVVPSIGVGEPQAGVTTKWSDLYTALVESGSATASSNPNSWLMQFLQLVNQNYVGDLTTLSPTTIIQMILQQLLPAIFSPTMYLYQNGTATKYQYLSFLNLALVDTSEFGFAAFQIAPLDASFWQTFSSFANLPFFELFADLRSADEVSEITAGLTNVMTGQSASLTTIGNAPPSLGPDGAQYYLIMRNTPFYDENWSNLIRHTVPAEDIVGYSLNKTRDDATNLYFVYPEAWMQALAPAVVNQWPALADVNSLLNYGLMPVSTGLYGVINLNDPNSWGDISSLTQYEEALIDWYWQNPTYLRGTISLKGDPKYRVGQVFYSPDRNIEGYIEGVEHQYVQFQEYRTTVTISRGNTPGFVPSLAQRQNGYYTDFVPQQAIQFGKNTTGLPQSETYKYGDSGNIGSSS